MIKLRQSQKIKIAVMNGVKTAGEYAQYLKRIKGELPREPIPEYMNAAIAEGVKNEQSNKRN